MKKEVGLGSTIPFGVLKIGPKGNRMEMKQKIVSNFSEQRKEFGMMFRVTIHPMRKKHLYARLVCSFYVLIFLNL